MKQAQELANEGMIISSENAERQLPGWNEQAANVIRFWLHFMGGREWHTEDLRQWATNMQFIHDPPNNSAWGQVIKSAAKAGIIECVGYSRCTSPASHGHIKPIWKQKK